MPRGFCSQVRLEDVGEDSPHELVARSVNAQAHAAGHDCQVTLGAEKLEHTVTLDEFAIEVVLGEGSPARVSQGQAVEDERELRIGEIVLAADVAQPVS